MLIRYLIIIIVLSLSLATALNLLGDYSIIFLKSNTADFSVVVYSLEEGISSLKDLIISSSIAYYNNSLIMLTEGTVN
jgi:hypothetical protein